VAATVDQDDTISAGDQRRDLASPIAAVAEAAVQQNHGQAGTIGAVPDLGPVIFYVAGAARWWKRRSSIRFESFELIIFDRRSHRVLS
jgi:hypothetical protein